jgi:AraC-like DNA-binding protein
MWVQQGSCGDTDWRVVADASPYLIATVTASAEARTMRVALVGARSRAAAVNTAGRVMTVGVRLRPGAVPILTGVSAREFVDRSVPVDCAFPARVVSNLELGHDAPISVVIHELIRIIRRATRSRAMHPILPDSWQAHTVSELAAWLRTPMRSLRERAHREVGLSPKRILRVMRLHTALHAARLPGASWSQVACGAGYADQAHFTRELRALLGETPSAWRARGSAVSFKTSGGEPG